MSYDCDVKNISVKDLKNSLMEMGLWEVGMDEQEMRDFYQTIKYSEQSANQEKEYRETLMNANKHCEEVMLLKSESCQTEKKEKEIEVTTIDDNSSDSNYSTEKKETEEVEMNDTVTSPGEEKREESAEKKNEVFFSYEKVGNDLCLDTVAALSPLYCRSVIQKLPQQFAMLALKKHHELIASVYKKSQKTVNLRPVPKGINLPKSSLNQKKEKSEEPQNEPIKKDVQNSTENEGYSCVRSRRHIKRKHYTEFNTDDEDDDELTAIKKCKEESLKTQLDYDSMDKIFDSLKETPVRKDGQSSDEEPSMPMKVSVEVHTETNGKKITTSTPLADKKWKRNVNIVSDNGMDDIIECFDDDSTTGSTQKRKNDQLDPIEDVTEWGSDSKEFIRRRIVPPNPYVDKLSQKMENKIKNLNNRRTKRPNSLCKPESQKNKSQSNKENEEDSGTGEIETKRFYGKTKANANKSRYAPPVKEDEYECPMCNKNFPLTFIEQHGATCRKIKQNEEKTEKRSSGVCYKCDKYILDDIEKHLEECTAIPT